MRTHYNHELKINNLGEIVKLNGWVAKTRNLGGLLFVDLRDRFGITQLTFKDLEILKLAETLKNEDVIEVSGLVIERESKNKNIETGEIEVLVNSLNILSRSNPLPIIIGDSNTLEETRLKYRYLDLRNPKQQQYLIKRHEIMQATRKVLVNQGFYELETPLLGKSTPEGARDYLVPSRIHKGHFYALPQSPQMYKQLFMVAGFEKYFQITKCFRDEDLRSDRQPEFTQIDIEASFVNEDNIQNLTETLLKGIFKDTLNLNIKTPFLKMTYNEAISKYGSDKPDMRFDVFVDDLNYLKNQEIPLFNGVNHIAGIKVNQQATFTRKIIDNINSDYKQKYGQIFAYIKKIDGEYSGSIIKFLSNDILNKLALQDDEIYFITGGEYESVQNALGTLRLQVAKELNLINQNDYKFLWVTDWPLLEYDQDNQRYVAMHHPFTAPKNNDDLINNPKRAIARAYDVVLNGYEIGGGSIRIHNQKVQKQMFNTLGFSDSDIKEQFGFFADALGYGTPPHGGIALGLDRIVMLVTKTNNIRDVIAFPKTQNARDLMMEAPGKVTSVQLAELNIEISGDHSEEN